MHIAVETAELPLRPHQLPLPAAECMHGCVFDTVKKYECLKGEEMLKASYKKLWKLLVDKDMSKASLHKATGLAPSTMTKLRRGEDVSMEALRKICNVLECNIGDIVEFVDGDTST